MSSWDVVVVGSGIGGLTVASLLTKLGHKRVLVLEKHFHAGGLTCAFQRGHWSWDVGLHYVGGMQPGEPARHLLDLVTDEAVDWRPTGDPYDVFLYPDLRFEVPVGAGAYQDRLTELFPAEKNAIRKYFADLHSAASWMGFQMYRKAMPHWVSSVAGLFGPHHEHLALATTEDYLGQRFADPRLAALVASQWGDYGLSPRESSFGIHAMVAGSYLEGASYPVGGGRGIARAVAKVLAETDGEIRVNREVTAIRVEGGRAVGVQVRHHHGARVDEEEYDAPIVISDIGAVPTWLGLVPESVELPFRDAVRSFEHGHSAVTVYLGLGADPATFGGTGANLWLYEGWDHDQTLARSAEVLEGRPSHAFLSFPSVKDPEARAPTAEIIAIVDRDGFEQWKDTGWRSRPQEYEALKARIADGLVDLAARRLPGLKEHIVYREVSTPLTVEAMTSHPYGAFYGVPAVPEKYREEWMNAETPVPGLYLTGSDVGALGIVGAAMGGVMTAGRLLGPMGFLKVMQPLRSPTP